jgi:hypothetical protein
MHYDRKNSDALDRVRVIGSLLFHYEINLPWENLVRVSAIVALDDGRALHMSAGDFALIARGEPMSSGRVTRRSLPRRSISVGSQRIFHPWSARPAPLAIDTVSAATGKKPAVETVAAPPWFKTARLWP